MAFLSLFMTDRRKTFSGVLPVLIALAFLFLSFSSLFFDLMSVFLLEFLFYLPFDLQHFLNHKLQVFLVSIAY